MSTSGTKYRSGRVRSSERRTCFSLVLVSSCAFITRASLRFDGDLPALRRLVLRDGQRQHAVAERRRGLRAVDVARQRDRARELAPATLAAMVAAVVGVRGPLAFTADRELAALRG